MSGKVTIHRLSTGVPGLIAEECGLLQSIGQWVLREACRQNQAWLQAGLDLGRIAINVSPVEFQGKGFLRPTRGC